MTPFAWASSKSAPANTDDTAQVIETPPYTLPFDGHRPVLVCGHTFSRKETFVAHLLTSSRDTRPVNVIDPMGKANYSFGRRPANVLRPDLSEGEGEFFIKAAEMVAKATGTEGGTLVIDEFLLMTEPYEHELPEQAAFVYVLDEALTAARRNRVRIIMVTSRVPDKAEMARFGCRFFISPILPMDWVVMFGRQHPAVEVENRPGTGVLHLDREYHAIEFPLTAPQEQAPEKTKRLFRLGKKTEKPAKAEKKPKKSTKGEDSTDDAQAD